MAKVSLRFGILISFFALMLFVGRPVSAQESGTPGGEDKAGAQDLNEDRQDGPNDNLQEGPNDERTDAREMDKSDGPSAQKLSQSAVQAMDAAHDNGPNHDGDVNEDRVEDQLQDQHEDALESPSSH